jgi:hypothetical protein
MVQRYRRDLYFYATPLGMNVRTYRWSDGAVKWPLLRNRSGRYSLAAWLPVV